MNRLGSLYALAIPGVCGVFFVYGVYDALRFGHYRDALITAPIGILLVSPLILVVLAEVGHRRFNEWLRANADRIGSEPVSYKGAPITAQTEVVVYYLAFSIVFASFKIPSRYYVVGYHHTIPRQIVFTLLSFLLGWWGIPWGPVYTLQALHINVCNLKRKKLIELRGGAEWEA